MSWQRGSRIEPRLIKPSDTDLQQQADELITLVKQHHGCRRQELEEALDEFIGSDPQYRLLRGWTKLLMDRCEFRVVSEIEPARLRETVFRKARELHPVLESSTRHDLYSKVAEALGCRSEDIEAGLYADLSQNQELVSFEELSAEDLLHRYNLAQAQALLYRCQQMVISLEPQSASSYRQLFDAVKFYRLIHTISGHAQTGYSVTLDGPVSLFHRSQKYGIQMAVFLPALLLCARWKMRAELEGKTGPVFYELTSEQRSLHSWRQAETMMGRPDLDKLLTDWSKGKHSATLERSQEVIDGGGTAWIPDLVGQKEGNKPVHIELLGFWTPRSLQAKLTQIKQTGTSHYLLAISNEMRCSRDELTTLPEKVILYKTAIDLRDLDEQISEEH